MNTEEGWIKVEHDTHLGVSSLKGSFAIAEFAEHVVADAVAGRTTMIQDLATDPRTARQYHDRYRPLAVQAYINVPLHRDGIWVANFWISTEHPREWTGDDVSFMQAVADRLWQVVEQSRMAAALRESEERFARFMEHLPGLAWIKDLEGRYVFANGAAERAFGTSREQLYGFTDESIFPAETALLFRENDRRAAESPSGIQTIETLEHADGVHHSMVHKFPIPSSHGQMALTGGMAIDITERIQAEEALRMSEQRYRAVVENQTEMVCRFRPDGTILFVNGAYARARAVTPEELVGRSFWDFVVAEDRAAVEAMLHSLTPETPEVRVENRLQTVNGARWTLWANRAIAFDDAGRLIEAQSTGIDITDRKQAEHSLEKLNAELTRANQVLAGANQDLERFAFIASHDLQEPLRMVRAYASYSFSLWRAAWTRRRWSTPAM